MQGRQVGSLWRRNKSHRRKCGARWHRQRRELKPQSEHPSGVSPGSRQLLAATGKFAGSFAGVAAGMAASVAAGEGSWLDTARSLLPSLSRGYKLLTPQAHGSPLCKTLPPSSTISKASLEILPRQHRSASLSTIYTLQAGVLQDLLDPVARHDRRRQQHVLFATPTWLLP